MDLKDVIADVRQKAIEAHNAFHAGHKDVARNYLGEIRSEIQVFFGEGKEPWGDVTAPTDKQKPAEVQSEKPDEVPDAQVRPAAVLPADEGSQVHPASQLQKPTQ